MNDHHVNLRIAHGALAGLEAATRAIRLIHANQVAQAQLLRAVVATHPEPEQLRDAWQQLSSHAATEAELGKAIDPAQIEQHEALLLALTELHAQLERDLPRS